jgi:heavy metal translocating P-type ATPase
MTWKLPEVRWAAIAAAAFSIGLAARLAHGPQPLYWAFFLACYVAGGWQPGLAGLAALKARVLDVDLLMVAAAIGAAAIGQVLDGGLLIVIFATSGALEAVATHRTAQAVRGLLDLAPERAVLALPDGTTSVVDATSLRAGDVIMLRPGERVAADGQVVGGASEVDQASITGEPLPAAKLPGDDVFAGTLNGTGTLTIKVTGTAAETVLARIVALVEEASATKARTQLFIEKVEQRYSAGMVTATTALLAVPLLLGEAFQPALLRAMTFMIVASPCAVVLATMPPLLAAMANASRHGVLVKSAVAMEEAGLAGVVAFDKTGTLTEGTPRLAEIRVLDAARGSHELLALAAAAESPSEHPLARAIVTAAREAGLPVARAEDFTALPGRGVTAVAGGHRVEIGSPAHLPGPKEMASAGTVPAAASSGISHLAAEAVTEMDRAVAEMEEGGQTAAVMRVDGVPVAVLGIADRIRPAAAAAVARITQLTGITPVLLTGDNERAAALLAAQAGITDVRAGLLPSGKVTAVGDLAASGRRVLLAGDGVNDAPALATASTGIAMGQAGSDLALDAADIVIMRDDLSAIPAIIALSRRARRVIAANLVIAGLVIAGLASWDLAGHLPLPFGVAGHEGSTVVVGLNGLRLLRRGAWGKASQSAR